jgi:hypothetical protein
MGESSTAMYNCRVFWSSYLDKYKQKQANLDQDQDPNISSSSLDMSGSSVLDIAGSSSPGDQSTAQGDGDVPAVAESIENAPIGSRLAIHDTSKLTKSSNSNQSMTKRSRTSVSPSPPAPPPPSADWKPKKKKKVQARTTASCVDCDRTPVRDTSKKHNEELHASIKKMRKKIGYECSPELSPEQRHNPLQPEPESSQ